METDITLVKKNTIGYIILCFLIMNVTISTGQIRLVKVEPSNNQTTIHNFGTSMVDISGYFFCTKRTYAALASATIISGSLNLAPGADIILEVNTASALSSVSSDLSIYLNNSNFGLAANMVDFMQYGDSFPNLNGRENEAVSQGFWAAGTFILGDPAPWSYTGDGNQNGVNFWGSTPLGINDEILNASLSIYPNPTSTTLNIKKLQNINLKEALIYDITGRKLSAINLKQTIDEKKVELDKFSNGVYYLLISDDQGGVVSRRFIKE